MPTKNKIIIIVVISTMFGLFSGVVGSIVARVYILEEAFNVPLFGDLSFKEQKDGSEIIIHNAKKVIVEQNVKAAEVIRSAKESLVWFYVKKIDEEDVEGKEIAAKEDGEFDVENYYRIGEHLAQGFILTSDGWLISEFVPDEAKPFLKTIKATSSKLAIQDLVKEYIVIDKNEKQYEITNIVFDPITNFSYYKVEANDLPVKKFKDFTEINIGQIAVAINSEGRAFLTTISGIGINEEKIESSDDFDSKLILNESPREEFFSSFVFDIDGNFLGLINRIGEVDPVSNFVSCINCLLERNTISRPSLGLFYIDLSRYYYEKDKRAGALITANENGVAFTSDSPAKEAGLLEGDIITSVNGQILDENNSLSRIVSNHNASDTLNIRFVRNSKEEQVDLILKKKE